MFQRLETRDPEVIYNSGEKDGGNWSADGYSRIRGRNPGVTTKLNPKSASVTQQQPVQNLTKSPTTMVKASAYPSTGLRFESMIE